MRADGGIQYNTATSPVLNVGGAVFSDVAAARNIAAVAHRLALLRKRPSIISTCKIVQILTFRKKRLLAMSNVSFLSIDKFVQQGIEESTVTLKAYSRSKISHTVERFYGGIEG